MYARGHVRTTRQQRASATDWYRKIEAATLARLEAEWPENNTASQEVPHDLRTSHASVHRQCTRYATPTLTHKEHVHARVHVYPADR